MINMIADAELALDHGRNPLLGPDIANKAVGFCSLLEQIWKRFALLLGQFRRRAKTRAISQRVRSARSSTSNPLADRALGHAHRHGDLFLRPALLMQVPRAQAAAFAPVSRLCYGTHGQHDTTSGSGLSGTGLATIQYQ